MFVSVFTFSCKSIYPCRLFLGSNCDSPVMFLAMRNNFCFTDDESMAFTTEFPRVIFYDSLASCSGDVYDIEAWTPDACEAPTGANDDYTEFSSYKVSLIGECWLSVIVLLSIFERKDTMKKGLRCVLLCLCDIITNFFVFQ